MRSRGALWVLVAVVQMLVIVGFVAVGEYRLRTGREYVLETRPVDPRDLFPGDYVALRYSISTVSWCCFQEGETIYVLLEESGGVWRAAGAEHEPPRDAQPFIRGQVTRVSSATARTVDVEYGIESYFVPEGTGRAIEDAIRRQQDAVRVRVVVDGSGAAAIKELVISE